MGRNVVKYSNLTSIIKKYQFNENCELRLEDALYGVIPDLKNSIELNLELNYINDIKEDVLKYRSNNKNVVLRKDDISNELFENLTIKVIESLDEQGLVLIIEPNGNIFIDIDYTKLAKYLHRNTTLNMVNIISCLTLVQETSIVDEKGDFLLDNYKRVYEEVLISADFEKHEVRHAYLVKILDYLDLLKVVYK